MEVISVNVTRSESQISCLRYLDFSDYLDEPRDCTHFGLGEGPGAGRECESFDAPHHADLVHVLKEWLLLGKFLAADRPSRSVTYGSRKFRPPPIKGTMILLSKWNAGKAWLDTLTQLQYSLLLI